MLARTMKPAVRVDADFETVIADAERLAEKLLESRENGAKLFAKALFVLTRNFRIALLADAPAEVLTRLHLKLETTMRLADADLPETSRDLEALGSNAPDLHATDTHAPEPPSQRPTIPYPPYLEPDASIEIDSRPSGFLAASGSSQVRRKVSAG